MTRQQAESALNTLIEENSNARFNHLVQRHKLEGENAEYCQLVINTCNTIEDVINQAFKDLDDVGIGI